MSLVNFEILSAKPDGVTAAIDDLLLSAQMHDSNLYYFSSFGREKPLQ